MPRENNSPIKPLGAKIKDCLANTLNVNLFVYGLFLCLMVCIGAIINNQYSITNIKEAKAEGIAQTVNYQARLMNSSGINVGDGTYSMKISIYSQASGGSHLWSASTTEQTPTGTVQPIEVEVKNGLFSILLGDTNNGQVAFPEGLFNNDTLYLGITVGADSEMTPRKRLSAVPYAYNSQTLQGQYASNTVASTGGDLFALHQSSNDSASAERTALAIYTSGTNNLYDLLIKANSGSDVFSVSRQGSVTTTGNLQVDGITQLGSTLSVAATSSLADLSLTGRVNSNLLPYITDTYSLGNSTYRWLGLYAQNVTTTNLAADYVTTTELWVDGVQVTGGIPNLDQVTDEGNITTNAIGVGGVSSTGDILPTQTLTYDLGSSARRWRDIWVSSTYIGDNTWNLKQDANNYFTIADVGGSRRLTIDTSGNVGIGITSPQKQLDVQDGIRLRQSSANNSAALIEFSNRNAAWGQGFSWNAYYDGTWKRRTADYPALYSFSSTGNMSYLTSGTGSADTAITWITPFTWFNSGGTAWGATYSGTDPGANNMIIEGNVGIGTINPSSFRLQVAGSVGPNANNLYDLGSPTLSWKNIYVSGTTAFNNVVYSWSAVQGNANTYLKNDGSGNLTWATVAGASTPSWQEVTDVGATTTHWVWFAGATSSGDLRPSTTLMYDLGTSAYRWDDVWGQVFHVGSSTWDLYQDGNQDFVIDNRGLANLDNFNNNSIETYWTTSTPVGTFTESGEQLTGYCSGICDWYSGALESSPIIHQPLSGGDFIVTTKIDTYTGGANTNVGLTLYTDRNNAINWVRNTTGFYAWHIVSDSASSIGISGSATDLPLWLRMRRVGTRIYFEYSTDGVSFTTSGSYNQPFSPANAGVFVKSWSGAITGVFDYFELNENIAQVRVSNTGTLLSGHHNGQDIGSFSNSWKNSYASGTYFGGYLNITGTSTLANLTPQSNNTYNIGVSGNAFKNIYASGTVDTAHLMTEGTRVRGQIGIFNTSSTVPRDGVVVGNKLYMVNGTVFNIFDVSNPLKPALIGSATTSDGYQVAVQGNYAYIADNAAGLRIFNISNPYSPTYVASSDIAATSGCGDIEVKDDYAYVACYGDGLKVVDISTPTAPSVVKTFYANLANRLDLQGDYVYVANGIGVPDFYIVDISDPANAFVAGTSDVGDDCRSVEVVGDYAYVGEWSGGGGDLIIYDVSDPTSPTKVGTGASPSLTSDDVMIDKYTGYVYMAKQSGGFEAWNVSNPAAPTLVYTFDPSYNVSWLISNNNYIYLGTGAADNIVYVYDLGYGQASVNGNLSVSGSSILNGITGVVDRSGYNQAAMYFDSNTKKLLLSENGSDYYSLLQTLQDVTDLGNITDNRIQFAGATSTNSIVPSTADAYNLGSLNYRWGSVFALNGKLTNVSTTRLDALGYVSTTALLVNATSTLANVTPWTDSTYDLGTSSKYWRNLYADNVNTFNLNLTPGSLTELYTLNHSAGNGVEAVEVVGNTMYIGVDTATGNLGDAGDDFQIIDITNPDRPRYIGGLSAGILRIYDIEIAGQYAYLIGERNETFGSAPNLYVVDISDPNNPSIVYSEVYANTLNYYWGNTLKISGNYLYVGGFHMTSAWHEIRVYDITDPTALSYVSGISLNTRVNSLDVLGNNYLVAATDDAAGYSNEDLLIFDISNPAAITYVDGLNLGANPVYDVKVRGSKIYAGTLTAASYSNREFFVIDASSSTNIYVEGSLDLAAAAVLKISLADDYAYVLQTNGYSSNEVSIINVASSTNPVYVGGYNPGAVTASKALTISGKTMVIGFDDAVSGSDLHIMDIGGLNTFAANIGNLWAGEFSVAGNGNIGQSLFVNNDIFAEQIQTRGDVLVGDDLSVLNDGVFRGRLTVNATSTLRNVLPFANNTYSLGTSGQSWRNIYASGTVYGTSIGADNPLTSNISVKSANSYSAITTGAMHTAGNYAYIVEANLSGGSRLRIVDISSSTAPVEVGSIFYPIIVSRTALYDVEVRGKYAYITYEINGNSDGIFITDISNPASPVNMSTTTVNQGGSGGLTVYGKYLYKAARESNRLVIYDISNPSSPQLVADHTVGSAPSSVRVQNGYAYVTNYAGNSLSVVNVSNPASPVTISTTAISTGPENLEVQGRYAYVAYYNDTQSFGVIDISNPSAPTQVATLPNLRTGNHVARGMRVQGDYVYLAANYNNNFTIIDVSKPTAPVRKATLTYSGVRSVDVRGQYIYLAYSTTDLAILKMPGVSTNALLADSADFGSLSVRNDAEVYRQLTVHGALNVGGEGIYSNGALGVGGSASIGGNTSIGGSATIASDLTVSGNTYLNNVFVSGTAAFDELWTQKMDAANPNTASVTQLASIAIGSTCHGAGVVQDNYYYHLCGGNGNPFKVVDVTDPTKPAYIASIALSTYSYALKVKGRYAYAGDGNGDIKIIDISKPSLPVVVRTVDAGPSQAVFHDIDANYLYYPDAAANSLEIYDISNPLLTSNTPIGTILTQGSSPRNVAVYNDYAYVTNYLGDSISVINISNPAAPVFIATTSAATRPTTPVVQGRYLYVAHDTSNLLYIYDLKNPASPVLSTTFNWGGNTGVSYAQNMVIQGRYAYMLREGGNMSIIDISSSTNPVLVATPVTTANGTGGIAVAGRYIYTNTYTGSTFKVFDMGGVEANGLVADSARLGNLQVLGDVFVSRSLIAHGGLDVGTAGLNSMGRLNVQSTSTLRNVLPFTHDTYSLGSDGQAWKNVYTTQLNTNKINLTPGAGTVLSRINTDIYAGADSVELMGNYMFVGIDDASGNYGVAGQDFQIFNISDPEYPKYMGGINFGTGRVYGIKIIGNYAYLAGADLDIPSGDTDRSFVVVDISDPYNPIALWGQNFDNSGYNRQATNMEVADNYLYIADNEIDSSGNDIRVYDISVPSLPVFVGGFNPGARVYEMTLMNDKYMAIASVNTVYSGEDVLMVDISDPSNITYVDGVEIGTNPVYGVKANGTELYVVTQQGAGISNREFAIIDASSSTNMNITGSFDLGTVATKDIALAMDYAYVLQDDGYGSNEVSIIDISSSTNPAYVTGINLGGFANVNQLMISGGLMAVAMDDDASGNDLYLVDINGLKTFAANIGNLSAGLFTVSGDGNIGNNLYVKNDIFAENLELTSNASISGTLRVDATSTMATVLPKSNNLYDLGALGSAWRNIYASGTIATENLTVRNINASNPSNASLVQKFSGALPGMTLGEVYALDVEGTVLYVSGGTATLGRDVSIYDYSVPGTPVLLSRTGDLSGTPYYLKARGDYLYVWLNPTTSGVQDRFAIIDVSNPASPVIVKNISTGIVGDIHSLDIEGNYLYVTISSSLYIYDISDPANMSSSPVATLATGGTRAGGIEVHDGFAFIANYTSNNVSVIDVSNPTTPVFVTTTTVGTAPVGIKVQGGYAYINHANSGITMSVLDIRNPASPSVVSTLDLAGYAIASVIDSIDVQGRYVYLSCYTGNVAYVIDVDNPSTPVLVASESLSSTGLGLAIDGKNMLVGYTGRGIEIHDLGGVEANALLAHTARIGSLEILKNVDIFDSLTVGNSLTVGKQGIYSIGGLTVTGASRTGSLGAITNNTYDLGGGGYAWRNIYASSTIMAPYYWAQDIDADNVTDSSLIQKFAGILPTISDGQLYSVDVDGSYLYVSGGIGSTGRVMSIFDYSNPTAPVFVGSSGDLTGVPVSIKVAGDYAYAWLDPTTIGVQDRLGVIDISNPSSPTLIKSVSTGIVGDVNSLDAVGNYVYFAISNSLYIYDVADPVNMSSSPVSTIGTQGTTPKGVKVYNGYAYVTNYGSANISVIDVRNPLSPVFVATTTVAANPVGIVAQGRYLYLHHANSATTLSILDIKNPASPVVVAALDLAGYAYSSITDSIDVHGKYVYLSCYTGNIGYVVDVSSSTAPVLAASEPLNAQGYGVAVDGKHVFWGYMNRGLEIHGLSGIETNSLLAHTASVGNLEVARDVNIFDRLTVGNHAVIGREGLYSLGSLITDGALRVKATSTLSDIQLSGRVNSNLLPYVDNTYDLGNATYRWRNLYGVNATFTNLYVSNDSNTNAFIQNGNSFGEIAVLGTNDNYALHFETNGVTKMKLGTTGNLDIGDSMIGTPRGDTSILLTKDGGDAFLETWSSDMSEGLVMRGDGTADYGVVRQLSGTGYTNGWAQGLHIYTGNKAGVDDPIIFTTGGFERMRIGETGNLYPTTDNTYDLGLPTNAWKNGYFDTAVNIGYQSGLSNVKFPRTAFFTASPAYNASGLDGLGFVFTVTSTLGNDNGLFAVTDKDYNLAIFAKNATSVALVGDHVEEFNITLGGDTGPRQHNSYNLGSDNRAWNHIYSSSTLYLGQATDGSAIKFTTSGYMAATPPGTDGTAAFAFWPTAYTPGSALFAVLDRPMGVGVGVPLFIQSATSVAFGGTDTEDDFLITTHGHVGPKTTYTYDLGSQDLAWRNLYTQRVSSTAVTVNGWLTQTATSPTLASTINTSDSSTFNLGVSISGNMVAVASYNNGQVRLYRINPDDSLTYLTGITFSGPDAVKLLGDRLYVSTELGAFHIYDVSDINNPVSLGSITGTGNGGKWFDIVGSYIYLAKDWSSDEFEIYDISNPANIQNVGGYATTTMDFRNIKVSGKYAYSASYSNSVWHKGLMRFDISDPKNVTYVTNYQDDYVVGFDIVGDVAYTINTAGTLRALDISSTTMSLIGSASKTVSGYNTKLIARGNMIYVLGDNNYLSIYKHLGGSNFQTIYTASDATYWASAKAMDISGNRLVVHGGSTRNVSLWKLNGTTLDSLDVANATVGSLQVLEDVNITSDLLMGGRLHAMGGALFEGDSAFRGGIKNVPLDPKFKYYYGSLGIGGESLRTIVRGDYQYTLDWGGTYLVIHDISNGKESPYLVGALSLGFTGGDLFINGQYAYVTYNAGILPGYKVNVYDISNPASISLVSSRAVAAGTNGTTNSIVQTRGSLMYLLTSYSDSCVLNTVDISDPRSMRSIDTYTVSASYACRDMAIRDKYLYALTAATIHKIDITIPRSTFEAGNAGTVSLNPQYSLDIKGSYLYVWKTNSNTGYISTYYINDTELELFNTATVTGAGNGELRVAGDYAYVVTKTTTDGVSMLHIFNVAGSSVPAVPILSKDLSSMGEDSYRFDISGDTIYLASEARSRVYALDLGGINSHAASIGSLEAYRVNIKGDANIDRELHVFGGSTLGGRVNMNKGGSANMNGDTDDDVTTSSPYNNYVISNEVFSVIDGRNLTYSDAIDTSYIYKTALFVAATGTYSLGSGDNGRNVGVAVSVPGYVSTGAGMSGVGVFSYLNGGGDPRTNIPTMPSAAGVFAVDSSVSTAYGLYAYSTNNNSVPTAQINNWSSGSSARTLVLTQGCSSGATTPIFEVYSGSGGDRELYVNCSGATYADGSYFNTGADYAEYMMHENKGFAAGDVAVLDLGHASSVKMAELGLRNQIVGVVSNNASVVGNVPLDIDSNEAVDSNKWVIVGMLGQLPTKFSNINGSISVGDKLMAGDNGYAVKAVGSGMVLGEALESTSATGTVMLYLHPHWWAGDLLDSDGSVNYVQDDLAFKATGLATTSTQGFGSNNLYFNGSGWNSINGQAVATGFAMGNRTTNATTSVFEITFATGTSDSMFGASRTMLSITNAGDMSVTGDLTVGRRLYLGSKTTGQGSTSTYLFVDDTLAPTSTYISTNADGWQTEDTYDYAERYESDQELSPGDIVTADGSGINKVKKATSIHEPVLGIVSTKPGFVTGRHYEGWYPIALAGRVPTRVSTLNGAIKVGDQLSASDMPGVAVKALGAGNVIGIALESYDKYEEGLISVFVKPGYMGGMLSEQTTAGGTTIINQTTNTTVADKVIEGLALIKAGASEVNISFATLQAYPMIYATPHSSVDGSWYIANRKDNGFTIITSEPQTHDVEFTWMARPMKAGTIKFVSDNTYHAVDDLTGQMYGPINPTDTATTTEPVIDPVATSTEPLIVTDEPQTLPEPPEETADTPTSTTNTQNQNSTTTQT